MLIMRNKRILLVILFGYPFIGFGAQHLTEFPDLCFGNKKLTVERYNDNLPNSVTKSATVKFSDSKRLLTLLEENSKISTMPLRTSGDGEKNPELNDIQAVLSALISAPFAVVRLTTSDLSRTPSLNQVFNVERDSILVAAHKFNSLAKKELGTNTQLISITEDERQKAIQQIEIKNQNKKGSLLKTGYPILIIPMVMCGGVFVWPCYNDG